MSKAVEDSVEDDDAPDSEVRAHRAPGHGSQTIVIVGHGMVGQRMCEEIRSRRSLDHYRVVVFGQDPYPAYDRVHLCRILHGDSPQSLQLAHSHWYADKRVQVVREPVDHIDRKRQAVRTKRGTVEHYDHLILATGSTPLKGKIPGNDGRDVCVLRSCDDALQIRRRALLAKDRGLPVVIVGGGLLGIELADELAGLGTQVQVLESADYPLSRQLERSAGELLGQMLARNQLVLRPCVRVTALVEGETCTEVHVEKSPAICAGLVVLAMGVRPSDQLAREAKLRCDLFGGVLVNDELLTQDPNISAIGECARHRGESYGLVAPGYSMAEAVAKRLAGHKTNFSTVQMGTRLKVRGLDLTVLGESQARGLGVKPYLYRERDTYRRLVLRRGKVIGLTSLGSWSDLPRVQEAMARAEKIKPIQLKRFALDEPMWKRGQLSLHAWPDSATVCTCMGVTCGTLKRAQREGCANVEALADRTGASTVCGSCRPLLATLTEDLPEEPDGDSTALRALSVLSLVGALTFLVWPAIPYSESVVGTNIDVLWRTSEYKQYTGFSLAGLFALSVLFSMRKRIAWLRFGDFEVWRIVHAGVGLLCLLGGFLHTGFRLGSNLDMALGLVFLGSVLLGGLAGGWSVVEATLSPQRARALRGWLIRSHIYLLWPLPILLGLHVAKVYFF